MLMAGADAEDDNGDANDSYVANTLGKILGAAFMAMPVLDLDGAVGATNLIVDVDLRSLSILSSTFLHLFLFFFFCCGRPKVSTINHHFSLSVAVL